jgi:integrase/recombinase XerD
MLEHLIKRKFYLDKHLKSPLLEEREDYIQFWAEKGLATSTLKSIADYTIRIVEFLHLEESNGLVSFQSVEKAALLWAELQINHPMKRAFSKTGKERFTWYAIHWLKRLHRLEPLPEEAVPLFCMLFERQHALKRHTFAPLLQERLLYLQYWYDHGAQLSTLRRIAQYLLQIMEYIQFFSLRPVTMAEIEKAAKRWANNETIKKRKGRYSQFAQARFTNDSSLWFDMLNCLQKPNEQPFPFQNLLNKYLEYLLQEQGLSENTIYTRFFQLRDFLSYISAKCETLEMITPMIIDEALTKKYDVDGYSRNSVQGYASVIRSFLRYAEEQKLCRKKLSETVKAPRVYSQESLPSSPLWDDIKKIVENSHNDYPTNIRDHAILQVLSVYGLRSSELTGLCLKDIDWKNERLYLRRSKRSKPQIFPLLSSVGNAILRYIQQVRPNDCRLKEVFISRKAPYRSLSTTAVYQIVSKRIKPLNLNIKHQGPHSLRHGCATHLINEGFSLKEISDHLGHQELETTRIYAKVDLLNLRKVAEMDWGDFL